MSSVVTKRRVARKRHQCECLRTIKPGHVYLEHIGFPGDLLDHITRIRECDRCAKQYGRGQLLGKLPIEQREVPSDA